MSTAGNYLTTERMLLVAALQVSALGLVAAEVGRYSLPAPWSYECDRSNSSYQVSCDWWTPQC